MSNEPLDITQLGYSRGIHSALAFFEESSGEDSSTYASKRAARLAFCLKVSGWTPGILSSVCMKPSISLSFARLAAAFSSAEG